ncbi:MAG: hypothetical protein K2X72_20985 [Reyranella sp.]|nr:hypothetical protein [Reyranella sp.]
MSSRTQHRRNRRTIAALLALAFSFLGGAEGAAAWEVEDGVESPSYAVTEPVSSNLNIDSVVLMCEAAGDATVLQLKIYLTDEGPLRPGRAATEQLKDDPRVEVSIDGRVFPTSLLFADEYVVLADGEHDRTPLLSDRLLDALQGGKHLQLRFDLVAEAPGHAAAFDGEAVIELGSAAIAAVRRCARPPAGPSGSTAFAGH